MSDKPRQYINLKIPQELADEIEKLVKDRKLGYRSRAEFVIEASRQRLIDIRKVKD